MKFEEAKKSAEEAGTKSSAKFRTTARSAIRIGYGVIAALAFSVLIVQWVGEHRRETVARIPEPQKVPVAAAVGCSHYHPCTLTVRGDGSTDTVRFVAALACFEDDVFWTHEKDLGYRVSYLGGAERRYACTKEQAASGTCNIGLFDAFRFVPKPGTPLPRYWFVPYGSSQC